jgi:catechol 2,3-dioxygenase-like lactoylglutathione lyase family enzyme
MTTPTESAGTRRAGIQMGSAAPTFLVADIAGTARWYVEHLGFQMAGAFPDRAPYAYASLQRDGVEIMLLSLAGFQKPDLTARRPEGLWDAYIRMRGVQLFYEGLGVREFVKMPLRKQPYGDWEFEVKDPNGYILVFGELVGE